MLAVIWWMYDGYAWLTNAIATDHLRHQLLLLGGMGAFLLVALAVPDAFDGEGLAFGIGYLAVVVLHAGMYLRGTSLSEVRAILRLVPFNLAAAVLVLSAERSAALPSGCSGDPPRCCSGSRPGSRRRKASSSWRSTSSSGTDW